MKKILLSLLTISFCFVNSSCRTPAKREKLNGLYKLSYYFTDYDKQTDVDWIKDRGSESYYLVGENNLGYYVSKTNDGNYLTKEIKIEFVYNEDGKVSEFNYTDGKGSYSHLYLVSDNSQPAFEHKYTSLFVSKTTIRYTKISDNYSIEHLESLINYDLTFVSYEKFKYEGAFVSDKWNQEESDNIYEFFYLHTDSLVADFYFKDKENGEQFIVNYPVEETYSSFVINNVEYQKMQDEGGSYYLQNGEEKFYNYGEYPKYVTDQFESEYESHLRSSE